MFVQYFIHHKAEITRLVGLLLSSLLMPSDSIRNVLNLSLLLRCVREMSDDRLQRVLRRDFPKTLGIIESLCVFEWNLSEVAVLESRIESLSFLELVESGNDSAALNPG